MNIIIVGNGVAGITAARIIKEKDPKVKVSIYTEESHHYYPRPRLYDVLSGKSEPKDIYIFSGEWYSKKGIKVHLNTKALRVDTEKKELVLENKLKVNFDKLLLANGAHSFVPPIKGTEKKGVFTLRSIKDALTIKEYTKNTQKSIIIGGGLLGLEFASSLQKLGQKVTVLEMAPWLLSKQLDRDGSTFLKKQLSSQDIHFILGTKAVEILGNKTVSAIMLDNGQEITEDLVLISAGVRPNLRLASNSSIKINLGVLVDSYMRTNADDVYAAGDVTEFKGKLYGIIPAALDQAKIAAVNMLDKEQKKYKATIPSTTIKIVGINLTSMGIVNPNEPKYEEIKKVDLEKGIYEKLLLEEGKIVGAILLGDRKKVLAIKKLMAKETDITKYKKSIINNDFNYTKITNLS
jgi:nitrite reductase (NADH) large subunit